jgi:hypothetical protein
MRVKRDVRWVSQMPGAAPKQQKDYAMTDIPAPIKTPTEITHTDIDFAHSAALLAIDMIENKGDVAKVRQVLVDIARTVTNSELPAAVPDSTCCTLCIQYKDDPVLYAQCLATCNPDC